MVTCCPAIPANWEFGASAHDLLTVGMTADCEKSPASSAAVRPPSLDRYGLEGTLSHWALKKKKVLSLPLYSFGKYTGPPTVKPTWCRLKSPLPSPT